MRPELTDDEGEVRELTEADFRNMRPLAEVDPAMVELVEAWRALTKPPGAEMPDTENLTRDLVNLFSEGEPEAAVSRLARFAARKATDALLTKTESDRWLRLSQALDRAMASIDDRQEALPLTEEDPSPPE
jgi:hypothetical protein